jgi:hypothetical protein
VPEFDPWSNSLYVNGNSDGYVNFDTNFADNGNPNYVEPLVVSGTARDRF